MTSPRPSLSSERNGSVPFPLARRGYDCTAVEQYAQAVSRHIADLEQRSAALARDNAELHSAVEDARARAAQVDFSGLGGRAQEILRIAEEQARDVTHQAAQQADEQLAQAYAEMTRRREAAASELAEIKASELSELERLRHQGEQGAAVQIARAKTESEQLMTSARLQAAAVETEARATADGLIQSARLEAEQLAAQAQQAAAALQQQSEHRRDETLAKLRRLQDDANATTAELLARATQAQRASSEHLTSEAEQAAELRKTALADAEQVRLSAAADASAIIGRAQEQAATIDERARQEFAWRRRQMREEQALLARRKQAMLSQLTSLSALAIETAENLPELPEMFIDDGEDFDPTLDIEESDSGDSPSEEPNDTRELAPSRT